MWSPMIVTEALDRVGVPVLLQTGWQDLFSIRRWSSTPPGGTASTWP
jgi:hypothetical protein